MKPRGTPRAAFALSAALACACGGDPPRRDAGPPPARLPTRPEIDPATVLEVPAGAFEMGHPDERQGPYGSEWFVNETPARAVQLAAFAIDRHEVTVEQYATFLTWAGGEWHYAPLQPVESDAAATTYRARPGTEREPMRHVTWYDAQAYCRWAGGRLPTEAEWERVARGDGEPRRFPWGADGPTCARAVFYTGGVPCAPGPQPVGTRPMGATPDGVHDLAGNVGEWVGDFYGSYPAEPQTNPTGPAEGTQRVVRGGGYRDVPSSMRTTARWGADPASRSEGVGFRCVYPR